MASGLREQRTRLSPLRAGALGLLQGPTELLPVSSSAHVALAPWLLGAPTPALDAATQQAFEVALHTGTALALGVAQRDEARAVLAGRDWRLLGVLAAASLPPALVGYAGEEAIAGRLASPAGMAGGLAAGALALAAGDRAPQRRPATDATVADGLWLGVAQAAALAPGISRNGATLAAARLRGFRRADASRLSRYCAAPVILGATALKTVRLARRGIARDVAAPVLAGASGAAVSTLACRRLLARVEGDRPLAPYAGYRLALAAVVIVKLRAGRCRPPHARR